MMLLFLLRLACSIYICSHPYIYAQDGQAWPLSMLVHRDLALNALSRMRAYRADTSLRLASQQAVALEQRG